MLIDTIKDIEESFLLVPSSDIDNDSIASTSERKRKKDTHISRRRWNKRQIDFVVAGKAAGDDEQREERQKIFFHHLKTKRLKISSPVLSQDGCTQFWKIHAPFDVLCDLAEDMSLRLPTKENDITVDVWYTEFLNRSVKFLNQCNPFIDKHSSFKKPRSYFADLFNKERINEFHNGDKPDLLFTRADRSRLVSYLIESAPCSDDPSDCGKVVLLNKGVFKAIYPCHDGPLVYDQIDPVAANNCMRQRLYDEWARFRNMFKYQPIDAIKEYFGVKIAFYFDWIGFYTTFLIPAALIGIFCFLYGVFSTLWMEPIEEICKPQNSSLYYMCPLCDKVCPYYLLKDTCSYATFTQFFDNDLTAFFSVFMSIWSVFYLEYWKRRQWTLSYKWHTMHFKEEEVVRPQYTAAADRYKENPITKKPEPFISHREHLFKVSGEASVVVFFVLLVLAATVGVIIYRAAVFGLLTASDSSLKSNSRLVVTATATLINLIVINLLKYLYKFIALRLTEWENPRTKSAFEKSFTLKMFWFQFCNTYASVFYVAFFKGEHFVGWPGKRRRFWKGRYRLEGCSVQGCFLELCVQLVILMGGQQLMGNIPEMLWPLIQMKWTQWRNNIEHSKDVPVWEADYQLVDQEEHKELALFWEYQEVVLQYGFVTMFVASFPLAPLLALITNLIEIRIDATNMLKSFRRPVAMLSTGIGVWYDILVTLTALSVVVNGFVLSLTSEFIPRLVYRYQISADYSLKGYVNWSLAHFNVNDFDAIERPESSIRSQYPTCRFPGFHESGPDYGFSKMHWKLWTIRLTFAFFFQWVVTGCARVLAWIIPDQPRSLSLKIKREEHLAKEATRNCKIQAGTRLPDLDFDTQDCRSSYRSSLNRSRSNATTEV